VIGGITPDLFYKARKLAQMSANDQRRRGRLPLDGKEYVESEVLLTNCKSVQGPTIADHAMSMPLAPTRGLKRFFVEQSREEWSRYVMA
jgi:hypothetical protein